MSNIRRKMFKKKKNTYIDGYIAGINAAVYILREQQKKYGDIASINDLFDLIEKNA